MNLLIGMYGANLMPRNHNKILNKILPTIFFAIPTFWLLGISVQDLCRILTLGIIILGFNRPKFWEITFANSKAITMLSGGILFGLILILTVSLAQRVFLGSTFIDTVIFSEAAQKFATSGEFTTSINRLFINNFMADHFAPILIIPAFLIKLGIPNYWSSIGAQFLFLIFGALAAFKLMRALNYNNASASILTTLLFFQATVRGNLYWQVQIEYWSIGFVCLAFLFWFKEKPILSFLFAVLSWTCKESLALWTISFALFAITHELVFRHGRSKKIYIFLLFVALGYFSTLIYAHTFLFGRRYDYLSRIEWRGIFEDLAQLQNKVFYLIFFLASVGFYLLRTKKRFVYLLPLASIFALALVSNKSDMHDITKQYSFFPGFLIFLITAIAYSDSAKKSAEHLISVPILPAVFSMCFSFMFFPLRPIKLIRNYSQNKLNPSPLNNIPITSRVVVTTKSAPFLLDRMQLIEMQNIGDNLVSFDFIAVEKNAEKDIPQSIKNQTRSFLVAHDWIILARRTDH